MARYRKIPTTAVTTPSFATMASCIKGSLYRILHHSTTINITGNSYRLKEKVKAGLIREPKLEQA